MSANAYLQSLPLIRPHGCVLCHVTAFGTMASQVRAALNLGDASPTARREPPKYSVTSGLSPLTSLVMKALLRASTSRRCSSSSTQPSVILSLLSGPLHTSTGQTMNSETGATILGWRYCTLIAAFSNQRPQQNPKTILYN